MGRADPRAVSDLECPVPSELVLNSEDKIKHEPRGCAQRVTCRGSNCTLTSSRLLRRESSLSLYCECWYHVLTFSRNSSCGCRFRSLAWLDLTGPGLVPSRVTWVQARRPTRSFFSFTVLRSVRKTLLLPFAFTPSMFFSGLVERNPVTSAWKVQTPSPNRSLDPLCW